mmetsp:Transcript_10103/g.29053  ORF Transcript_10103/g.29053 Transcript_10103/m.29053 type:complete len:204 (-) Transcript_10103:61-672(-)
MPVACLPTHSPSCNNSSYVILSGSAMSSSSGEMSSLSSIAWPCVVCLAVRDTPAYANILSRCALSSSSMSFLANASDGSIPISSSSLVVVSSSSVSSASTCVTSRPPRPTLRNVFVPSGDSSRVGETARVLLFELLLVLIAYSSSFVLNCRLFVVAFSSDSPLLNCSAKYARSCSCNTRASARSGSYIFKAYSKKKRWGYRPR